MTTTSQRFTILILTAVLLHAAGARAAGDAGLCRRQVQKARLTCVAAARSEDSPFARSAAARACRDTARARARACQMRGGSATVSMAASLASVSSTASPTLTTDQFDYHPGQTITISGTGWQSGEHIAMVLSVDPPTHGDVALTSVADAAGNFTNTDYIVQWSDLNVVFTLTATGQSSGTVRTAGFTDSNLGLGQVSDVSPTDGGCGRSGNVEALTAARCNGRVGIGVSVFFCALNI